MSVVCLFVSSGRYCCMSFSHSLVVVLIVDVVVPSVYVTDVFIVFCVCFLFFYTEHTTFQVFSLSPPVAYLFYSVCLMLGDCL